MEKTDLYSILLDYALRQKSPKIALVAFQDKLTAKAKHKALKHPVWKDWATRPHEKFQNGLEQLLNEKKITVETEETTEYIYIPAYFLELIKEQWASFTENIGGLFPNSDSFENAIPKNLVRNVDFIEEFPALMAETPEYDLSILNIIFPNNAGTVLASQSIAANRFLESAILKLNNFFREEEIFQYFFSKIQDKVPALINQVNNVLKMIVSYPNDCIIEIKNGNENLLIAWTTLCNVIIEYLSDIELKTDDDTAILQSAYIVNTFAVHYRDIAFHEDGTEQYIAVLNENLSKSPYIYSKTMVEKFIDANGRLLIEKYSKSLLAKTLKKMTTTHANSSQLPDLLTFFDKINDSWFVQKEKVYPCFSILVNQFKDTARNIVLARWKELLRNYDDENAMRSDKDFETLIIETAKAKKYLLASIYGNTKFALAKNELQYDTDNQNLVINYFGERGQLLPLYKILRLDRRGIRNKVLSELPFWYSIPLLFSIIRFFKIRKRL